MKGDRPLLRENKITVFASAELLTLLRERFPSDCYLANSIQVFFLEYFKANFIEKFGQEKYDEQLAKASRTMVQIKDDNLKNKLEKIQKQKEKLKVEEQKLQQTAEPEDPERRAEEMLEEDNQFLKENDAERERELAKIRDKQLHDAQRETRT